MDEPDSLTARDAVSPMTLVLPITDGPQGDDPKRMSSKRRKLPAWSYEEEYILAKLHSELGTAWASIAEKLPGRSAIEAKNIWHSTLRSKAPIRRSLLFEYVHAVQGSRDAKTRREAFRFAVKLRGFQRPKRGGGSLSRRRNSDESDNERLSPTAPAAAVSAAASVPLPSTPSRHVVEVMPTAAGQAHKDAGGQDLPAVIVKLEAVMVKLEADPEAGCDQDKDMAASGGPPGGPEGVGLGGGGSTGWSSDGSGSSRCDGGSPGFLADNHTDKGTKAPEPGGVRGSSPHVRAPRLSSSCQPTDSNAAPAVELGCTVAAGRVELEATVAGGVDPTLAGGRGAPAWCPAHHQHPALGCVPTASATPGAGQGHPSRHLGINCPWAEGTASGRPWPAAEAAAMTRAATTATVTGSVTELEPGSAALQTSLGQCMANVSRQAAADMHVRSLLRVRYDTVWGRQHPRLLFRQGRPFEVVTLGLSALHDPELLQCVAAWEVPVW